jgi:hypothetical protein
LAAAKANSAGTRSPPATLLDAIRLFVEAELAKHELRVSRNLAYCVAGDWTFHSTNWGGEYSTRMTFSFEDHLTDKFVSDNSHFFAEASYSTATSG